MSNPLARAILDALPDQTLRLDPVQCASVSPFTVKIAGATTAVPAELIDGVTAFSLNEHGYAIWVPGFTLPLCFTTS